MKILEAAYKWKKQKTASDQDWKHCTNNTFVYLGNA